MAFDSNQLTRIFNRTSGKCHICRKKLCRNNYGEFGRRGAWEVEHSVAQCKGGTDHCNNLYAACVSCNRRKGKLTTATARSWHGHTKAPMSVDRQEKARIENTVLGMLGGSLAGLAVGGPVGCFLGLAAGGGIANSLDPDQTG
jgi:hypothetical protein